MSTGCDHFLNQIPRGILADLEPSDQQALDQHLRECASCSREKEQYEHTLGSLRAHGDDPVPRHFLVYPEERRTNPWRLFRALPLAWQGSVAAAAAVLLLFSATAAAKLQVRSEDGVYMLSFGKAPQVRKAPVNSPAIDTAALEARIIQAVEERNRKESLEWVRTLRAELTRSQKRLSDGERASIDAAFAGMETRLNTRFDDATRTLDDRTSRTMAAFYQAMKLQREGDLTLIDSRLNRLAVSGEIKNAQTDAVLETLLQVAELKTK